MSPPAPVPPPVAPAAPAATTVAPEPAPAQGRRPVAGTPERAAPAAEPARAVVELRHPLAAGRVEIRVDGRLVARIRLGDPLQAPAGRPAIASFAVPPGEHLLEVAVEADDGTGVRWSTRETWTAGGFRADRLTVTRSGGRLVIEPR
ncbi:MAG: hypothetical protein D6738_04500 [Acidobacteria bacterium]|nr:MAG: hypothetical protein D6738_04500 [Acidobacteriota bacterium]